MPLPLVSPGALSPENRYSGAPFSVTWVTPTFTTVPSPVTPDVPLADVEPAGNTSGGQATAHAPVHGTGVPLFFNVYSVMPLSSTSTEPSLVVIATSTTGVPVPPLVVLGAAVGRAVRRDSQLPCHPTTRTRRA